MVRLKILNFMKPKIYPPYFEQSSGFLRYLAIGFLSAFPNVNFVNRGEQRIYILWWRVFLFGVSFQFYSQVLTQQKTCLVIRSQLWECCEWTSSFFYCSCVNIFNPKRTGRWHKWPVSLIVPDFTIFVLGSWCNSRIFSLIHSYFLCLSISCHSILPWGCH